MRINLHNQMRERHEQLRVEQELEVTNSRPSSSSSTSSSSSSSSSDSSTSWTSSSSSYTHSSGKNSARGQPFLGETVWGQGQRNNFFSNQSTVYGPKPDVYDRSYQYSSNSRSRSYN